MKLTEMIYRRKSVRSYTNVPVDADTLQKIEEFVAGAKPLYPEIKVKMEIVNRNQVKCICPWTTPQLVTIFSEKKPGYLENVGFIFQQLDLYLQSMGIGTVDLLLALLAQHHICCFLDIVVTVNEQYQVHLFFYWCHIQSLF